MSAAQHRAVIEEAAQVLESAAAHNRSKGRTVLERTQQDRADRLRAVLAAIIAAPQAPDAERALQADLGLAELTCEQLRARLDQANEYIVRLEAERAPSGDAIATWKQRTDAEMPTAMERVQWEIHRAKDDEIADLRAALARRATAGTTAAPAKHSPDCENAGCAGCIDPHELAGQLAGNAAPRCPHCDDTGDVHRADGEWLGTCICPAGKAAPDYPALRLFLNAAYPVASQINPRGYNWCETYLDQARAAAIAEIAGNAATAAPGELPKAQHQIDIYRNDGTVTSIDGYTAEQVRQAQRDAIAAYSMALDDITGDEPDWWYRLQAAAEQLDDSGATANAIDVRCIAGKLLLDGRTASNAAAAPAIPEGFKLVPIKITDEMIEAAFEAHYGKRRVREVGGARGIDMTVNDTNWDGYHAMRRFWKGALAAAPSDNSPVGRKGPQA